MHVDSALHMARSSVDVGKIVSRPLASKHIGSNRTSGTGRQSTKSMRRKAHV